MRENFETAITPQSIDVGTDELVTRFVVWCCLY